MAGKERSIEIVNSVGGRVALLDGDVGIQGPNGQLFQTEEGVTVPLLATSVDTYVWTARDGTWQIVGVISITSVVGGAGANVTVRVCPGVTAPASGVAQLTGTIDLTIAAPSKVNGTLIASPTVIQAGDSVAIDMSGTLTGLVGNLTIWLRKLS
ncbi:MAG: hypothetical protein ACRCZI_14950 [Cetobacterium sp.]